MFICWADAARRGKGSGSIDFPVSGAILFECRKLTSQSTEAQGLGGSCKPTHSEVGECSLCEKTGRGDHHIRKTGSGANRNPDGGNLKGLYSGQRIHEFIFQSSEPQ